MEDADDAQPARFSGRRPPRACPGAEVLVGALVERLRARRDDLASALGGRALSVEIVLVPATGNPQRLGFAGEGYVTTLSPSNPLTLGFTPDVVVRGAVEDVLAALTAEEPLAEAVACADAQIWPRYARVHRIVATELRAIL